MSLYDNYSSQMNKNDILKIYENSQTIFTPKDIAIILGVSENILRQKIKRYLKSKKLISLRRGIYAKNEEYNPYELGQKIYTPSYVSFETVLAEAGVIFQYYETIFLASYLSREIKVGKNKFMYRQLNPSILTNLAGVVERDGYYIATPERALLDMIYLFPNIYFDNLSLIDWDKAVNLVEIYNNKKMKKNLLRRMKEAQNAG